jgi:hypothetical protein
VRVQGARGVECGADPGEERPLGGGAGQVEPGRLQRADAVLGGDRATQRRDEGEHRVLVTAVRGRRGRRGNDVDVHVAVGDMAERDDPRSGIGLRDDVRYRGREPHPVSGGDGDVELDGDAEEPGRLGLAFPVGPEAPSFGRGLPDGGVPVADDVREIIERGGACGLKQEIRLLRCRQGRH